MATLPIPAADNPASVDRDDLLAVFPHDGGDPVAQKIADVAPAVVSESTQAQAEAGTDDATANATRMTPRRTKAAIDNQAVTPSDLEGRANDGFSSWATAKALIDSAADRRGVWSIATNGSEAPANTDTQALSAVADGDATLLIGHDPHRSRPGDGGVRSRAECRLASVGHRGLYLPLGAARPGLAHQDHHHGGGHQGRRRERRLPLRPGHNRRGGHAARRCGLFSGCRIRRPRR